MVDNEAYMKSLTTEQMQRLVEISIEECGDDMDQDEFTDVLLGLLEDIAGFETASQRSVNNLTQRLWRKYNE